MGGGEEGIWGDGPLRMTMLINVPGMTGNDYFTSFCTIRLEKQNNGTVLYLINS